MISPRERLAAAACGERPDRPLVALWRHFPTDDQDAERLALSAAAFQREYGWDLLKLTPASHGSVADWGVTAAYQGHAEGTSTYQRRAIHTPADWLRLAPLDPSVGALGQQLEAIRRTRALIGPDLPLLATVFSPLAQAKHLAGDGLELVHLRHYPEELTRGLETITATTERFVEQALAVGADGIFYAVQHAAASMLSPEEYRAVAQPLDLRVLAVAKGALFNLLHLHGQHTYFDLVADYPVHGLNWHDRETGPALGEGARRFPGLPVGGLSQRDLVEGTPAQIRALAEEAIRATAGRLCLSTGCVLPTVAPWGNLRALRACVEG